MFGLIRKKKVVDALRYIASEYDSLMPQPGMNSTESYYYCCGNMNCANYVWRKIGCNGTIIEKKEVQE